MVKSVEAVRNCALNECLCVLHIYITATFIESMADILLSYQAIPIYIKIPEKSSYKIISNSNEFFKIEHNAQVFCLTYFISISNFIKQFFDFLVCHFLIWFLKCRHKNLSDVFFQTKTVIVHYFCLIYYLFIRFFLRTKTRVVKSFIKFFPFI